MRKSLEKFVPDNVSFHWTSVEEVMGPGQKILTRARSIFCGLGQVGSAIYGLG